MARRWRKKTRKTVVLGALGAAIFTLLAWIATQIPWDSVSFVTLILLLLIFVGISINSLLRVARFHITKIQKMERASKIKTATQMGFMSPTDFEHYVATLYEGLGYKVTVTKQSGDAGIDLIMKNPDGTVAVQVKRFNGHNVGRPDIQKLIGAGRSYDKMIFVTSSDFTSEARAEALDAGVLLVDGKSLETMAEKVFGKTYLQHAFSFRFLRKMEQI